MDKSSLLTGKLDLDLKKNYKQYHMAHSLIRNTDLDIVINW